MAEQRQQLFELTMYLNNALMQSPADISKTQKAIDYIKHFGGISRVNRGNLEHGTHHITLVLTNNNLSETRQWNIRLGNRLSHLNTLILSSASNGDKDHIKNIPALSHKLLMMTSANDLPDLIVMCTHEKRAHDVIELIRLLKNNNLDLRAIGIHHITLSIMMDEADKNMKLIVSLLKEMWTHLTMPELNKDNVLRDIHFITATPLQDFWKALKKCGISKLKNINHAIANMDETHVLHTNYTDIMENYRWLCDHERNHRIPDHTKRAVDYAYAAMMSWGPPSVDHPRIVFAPAENEKSSHYEMRDIFLQHGYWVYVDNSDKGKGKGFYCPSGGRFQSLDDFRKEHGVTGEPYETFKKWKEIHLTESLMITGWLTIIRGITFNTTGFNFTDMILSESHMHNVSDLLQVSGRANGDVKYVGRFMIHCPETVWTVLDTQIRLMAELHEKNVDEFEEKHFRPRTKRDEQEVAWTIPRVFPVTEEQYATIQKVGNSKKWDTETIFALLTDAELVTELRRRKAEGGQFQITRPEKPDTYKKYITDFIQKAQEGRKFNMGLHAEDKDKDGYQIFLDHQGHHIIVSLYNGSAIDPTY